MRATASALCATACLHVHWGRGMLTWKAQRTMSAAGGVPKGYRELASLVPRPFPFFLPRKQPGYEANRELYSYTLFTLRSRGTSA